MGIESDLIRHQLFIQRHGSGIYNELLPDLKQLRDRISTKILSSTPYQMERLSLILKEIDTIIASGTARFQPSLWGDFAEYENEFSLKMLDNNTQNVAIGAGLNAEAMAVVIGSSQMELDGKKKLTIAQAIDTFSKRYSKDIKSEIEFGIASGETTEQIARRIQSLSNNRTRQQAKALVTTITNHVGNEVRSKVWEDYEDLFEGYEYVATLDARTTIICASRDGKVYPFDKFPPLPAHWNCLTGDALVSTRYPISYITRRIYKGSIYTIKTSSGNVLKCTPNHPILTDRGFIPAETITEFDKIATDLVGEGLRFVDNQNDKGVSTIENLFSSLGESFGVSTVQVPHPSENFHGDMTDDKIDIVSINRELFFKDNALIDKNFAKSSFISTYYLTFALSVISQKFIRWNKIFSSNMSRFNLLNPLLIAHKTPFDSFLFGLVSKFNALAQKFSSKKLQRNIHSTCNTTKPDTILVQSNTALECDSSINPLVKVIRDTSSFYNNPLDDFTRDEKLFSDISDGSLGDKVFFDNVVSVSFTKDVLTHVYNLENDLGYYTANNLITHNCRSVKLPKIKAEYSLGIDTTRSSMNGQVSSKLTYSGWLKGQSKEVQNEVLGVERAKLFRSGKITLDRFVDSSGRTYTLQELKQKDLIR